jgi:hypothetical protein
LDAASWQVQDYKNLNLGLRLAIRGVPLRPIDGKPFKVWYDTRFKADEFEAFEVCKPKWAKFSVTQLSLATEWAKTFQHRDRLRCF